MLHIARAQPADLDAVDKLREEASQWLLSRGIDQWPHPWTVERLAATAAKHKLYLALLNGRSAGTFTIQWSDEEIWGEMPDDAGYIHRLIVARDFKGRGFGRELLRYAEQQIRAKGNRFARLDCRSDNPKLCAYYENVGYVYQRSAETRWGLLNLYEKALSENLVRKKTTNGS